MPDAAAPGRPLSSASRLQLVCRIPKQTLIRTYKNNLDIYGISYNSARDELFLADNANKVVRAIRVRDNAGDLRDVYRSPLVYSVCHMSDSDTLLVCSGEEEPERNWANWLVALRRYNSEWREWREAQRVKTDREGQISCAINDSRVLIGESNSTYMELFRVESGQRIARVYRIHVPEKYYWFSATCGSDTLVAMSYPYPDQSVRVHRLRGDRLEKLPSIQLKQPAFLLWLADRLFVADFDKGKKSDAVIEFLVRDTRLECRRELIATSENIEVKRFGAVNDRLAIFDEHSSDILHYSLN